MPWNKLTKAHLAFYVLALLSANFALSIIFGWSQDLQRIFHKILHLNSEYNYSAFKVYSYAFYNFMARFSLNCRFQNHHVMLLPWISLSLSLSLSLSRPSHLSGPLDYILCPFIPILIGRPTSAGSWDGV